MSSYEERMSQKYNFFSSEDKNQVSDSEVEKKTKNEEITENVDEVNENSRRRKHARSNICLEESFRPTRKFT